MSQPIRIDFVALAPVTAQTPPHAATKRGGKSKPAQTLVIFMGQDFAFGATTRKLIGAEGEALIKRAAGATKFKGKEQTALDIVAPSGFAADRLLVIGTGAAADPSAKGQGKTAKESGGKDECRHRRQRDGRKARRLHQSRRLCIGQARRRRLRLGRLRSAARRRRRGRWRRPNSSRACGCATISSTPTRRRKRTMRTTGGDADFGRRRRAVGARGAKPRRATPWPKAWRIARTLVNEPANVLYPEEFAEPRAGARKARRRGRDPR